ncbi:MAG: lamin tail domain-containing protein, partial [Chitinispirillia bacterium]|nr:lamin tail domain-containing protein [Chitinispirillia bacterium]
MAVAAFVSCTQNADPAGPEEYGTIEIRARVVNLTPSQAKVAGQSAVLATIADKLVIEVSGDGLSPARFESGKLDLSRPSLTETIARVPIGKNRHVTVWAVDKAGGVTHIDSLEYRTVSIEAASVTPVVATLIPAAGSIYLQFAGLSTAVGSVCASFTALDGTVVAAGTVSRAARTFMSLDNIPHETAGVLRVAIVAVGGDTTHIATRELTFNARGDNSIDLQFMENSGMIAVDVTMFAPGVTSGYYDFSRMESTVVETGELIITEIMWNVGNDNYIEVYNPGGEARFFETLTTDIDGTVRDFENVTVGGGAYLVIGRQALPHVDIHTSATGGLPVSTTGNWITLRRGRTGP